jgi:hypothetical protein
MVAMRRIGRIDANPEEGNRSGNLIVTIRLVNSGVTLVRRLQSGRTLELNYEKEHL